MSKILPLTPKQVIYLSSHNLTAKFEKQIRLLQADQRHPSLHNELLNPHEVGLRSFRIDLAYRAVFIYDSVKDEIEIIAINKHYQ